MITATLLIKLCLLKLGINWQNINIPVLNEMSTHRFSRARLRTAHEVTATHNNRYCPFLYWRRLVIVSLSYVLFQHFADVCSHKTVTEKHRDIILTAIFKSHPFALNRTKTFHNTPISLQL